MKKNTIFLFIIMIFSFLFIMDVNAFSDTRIKNNFPSGKDSNSFNEDNLYGKCVYKDDSINVTIYIDIDMNIYYDSSEYLSGENSNLMPSPNYSFVPSLAFGDFFDTTKKMFDCSALPHIYFNKHTLTSSQYLTNYKITITKEAELKNSSKLLLDKAASVSYSKKVDDVASDAGYTNVCNYGQYYLMFNKTSYKTNIPNNGYISAYIKGRKPPYVDIMTFLAENSYSCPLYYCGEAQDEEDFSNTKIHKKCIISSTFFSDRKYHCGSLSSLFQDIETANAENSLVMPYVEKIRKFCSTIVSKLDYNDPSKCVEECLKVEKDIAILLSDGSVSQSCGFSEKLILWIGNIIRWAKYIVPVAVIVLGILDFMKAISADKDDEMKKAQQRFIRRLIAAALIFIAPFIIEFILNKLGFNANGCGIINL